jgi:hypothetical protein
MISLLSILSEIKDTTITCKDCGWHWKLSDGGKDPYTCHKCHPNNQSEGKNKGLWANIHAKREKGEKPSHGNSNAFKKAVKAGKDINKGLQEKNKGLWANINAKQDRGEKPSHGNSNAFKKAVKAAKDINKGK